MKVRFSKVTPLVLTVASQVILAQAFAAQSKPSQSAPAGFTPIKTPEEVNVGGLDVFVEPEQHKPRNCTIRVKLNTHFRDNPVDKFMAYPYPVKPLEKKLKTAPLPDDPKNVKAYLMSSCYAGKRAKTYAYPTYGYRWRYALEEARSQAGNPHDPHTFLTVYPFIRMLTPYMVPICKRMNEEEKARDRRLEAAVELYQKKHIQLENESAQAGLEPVPITINKRGEAQITVQPGNWWIAGSRKVPAIVEYWEQPVSISSGETAGIVLNEANALMISGGW